jgi:hypothetical protein
MKVIKGDNIYFDEVPYTGEIYAEVHGEYEIVEMTDDEYAEFAENTQETWVSSEYEGKIYHVKEIKL